MYKIKHNTHIFFSEVRGLQFIFTSCWQVQEIINITCLLHEHLMPIVLATQVQWAINSLCYTSVHISAIKYYWIFPLSLSSVFFSKACRCCEDSGPLPPLLVCSLRASEQCSTKNLFPKALKQRKIKWRLFQAIFPLLHSKGDKGMKPK